jgi:hypothetical protein
MQRAGDVLGGETGMHAAPQRDGEAGGKCAGGIRFTRGRA